ncbi:hypothetical protein BU15DRAFT_67162 [Melanogaster broomeanus]|nr:hypothetical protein BU15DRAFT_67162 [Melanogaster broomeanus]
MSTNRVLDSSPVLKKRRTLEALPDHDEQDVVANSCHEKERKQPEAEKESDSSPSPALLHYRVSPPPSRRQPQIQPARAASVERADSHPASAAPVTPPRRLFLPEACPPKRLFSLGGKRKVRDRSRESISSQGIKRTKIHSSNSDRDNATTSDGERSSGSTESHKKKLLFADGTEREAVFSEPIRQGSSYRYVAGKDTERLEPLQYAREERKRRETAAEARLASREGLRAGAVVAERDEPARRAMGPHRSD